MQTTNTTPSPALDPAKNNGWDFLEVWIDPMQSPPYLLMLLGDQSGRWRILNPAEQYKLVRYYDSYDQAQLWLLEDEYEPLEGRLSEAEVVRG
ncbi:MAG: hypothetical protein HC857_07065 [Synechococcales cyanobacterium RU_4_20]|nr:hypothetical protein [Synechococcales cyanobacterium RU_4_20]NJR71028.1 hypothetical protein [Synechococcales cyanobacterium CRU_2_2]